MIKEGRVPLFVGPYQNKTILLSISSESEMSGIQIIISYYIVCSSSTQKLKQILMSMKPEIRGIQNIY